MRTYYFERHEHCYYIYSADSDIAEVDICTDFHHTGYDRSSLGGYYRIDYFVAAQDSSSYYMLDIVEASALVADKLFAVVVVEAHTTAR